MFELFLCVYVKTFVWSVPFGPELGGRHSIIFYLTIVCPKLMESNLSTNCLVYLISSQMNVKTWILHSSNGLGRHHSCTPFPVPKNSDVSESLTIGLGIKFSLHLQVNRKIILLCVWPVLITFFSCAMTHLNISHGITWLLYRHVRLTWVSQLRLTWW